MAKEPVQYFVVDAFTNAAFKGNPAAVCILEEERDDAWLQSVAVEFNISQTSFLIRHIQSDSTNPRFSLRWFTPVSEVKLCGHATLAASHALFTNGFVKSNVIEFETLSGILTAKKFSDNGEAKDSFLIELNFPPLDTVEFNSNEIEFVAKALSLSASSIIDIKRTTPADDIFVVLPSGKAVMELKPEIDRIRKCSGRGIIVSGVAPPESGFDFYSRFFCPKQGIDEDPVCGSAHCALAPYWSKKLGKSDLLAYQASPRSGILDIHLDEKNHRVLLRGKSVTVMKGTLLV